ncbi:MAG: DUF3810 domain-containing protein [Acidobacteria bacterium]|jgi:hypothetical protein|nr:DUF3810 domain-containing protein [Acidobacteriota bacterium]
MSGGGRAARQPAVATPVAWAGLAFGLGAFLAFQVLRRRPALAESLFSAGFYPPAAETLAALSSRVPFSLAELSFGLVALIALAAPVRGWRRARRNDGTRVRAALAAFATLAGTAGWIWAIFLTLWGFNYTRPLAGQLFALPKAEAPRDAAVVAQIPGILNALRAGLAEDGKGIVAEPSDLAALDDELARLQSEVLADAGLPRVAGGRTKSFVSSPLMLRWGVSGVYGPFTGEPNIALPAAPGTLPFTVAHERAHLQGFAWEEDASFVALLTLWRSPRPELRYAAWLELWMQLRRPPKGLSEAVRRDLTAIAAFQRAHRGREAPAMNRAYSAYLEAHGVKGGVASYARAAGLALRWLAAHGSPDQPASSSTDSNSPM